VYTPAPGCTCVRWLLLVVVVVVVVIVVVLVKRDA